MQCCSLTWILKTGMILYSSVSDKDSLISPWCGVKSCETLPKL